jgi:hypothetical protein
VAEKRNACRILVDRPEGKKSLGKPGRRWVDKVDIKDICWEGVNWIDLAQDKDKWRDPTNKVMNLRVAISVLAGELSAFEQGRCCVELVNVRWRWHVDAAASRIVFHVPFLSAVADWHGYCTVVWQLMIQQGQWLLHAPFTLITELWYW